MSYLVDGDVLARFTLIKVALDTELRSGIAVLQHHFL